VVVNTSNGRRLWPAMVSDWRISSGTAITEAIAVSLMVIERIEPKAGNMLVRTFFALPILTGVTFPPFWAALTALTAHLAAYVSEIVRAGIGSIRPGQMRAALALGMSRAQAVRKINLPQALVRSAHAVHIERQRHADCGRPVGSRRPDRAAHGSGAGGGCDDMILAAGLRPTRQLTRRLFGRERFFSVGPPPR
jgi:hypothetical protein